MAHTYNVQSATYLPGSSADPQVTIVGTVDGIAITCFTWLSVLAAANTQGGLPAVKNVVAPLMLAQVPPPPTAPTQLPTGTFVQ